MQYLASQQPPADLVLISLPHHQGITDFQNQHAMNSIFDMKCTLFLLVLVELRQFELKLSLHCLDLGAIIFVLDCWWLLLLAWRILFVLALAPIVCIRAELIRDKLLEGSTVPTILDVIFRT